MCGWTIRALLKFGKIGIICLHVVDHKFYSRCEALYANAENYTCAIQEAHLHFLKLRLLLIAMKVLSQTNPFLWVRFRSPFAARRGTTLPRKMRLPPVQNIWQLIAHLLNPRRGWPLTFMWFAGRPINLFGHTWARNLPI